MLYVNLCKSVYQYVVQLYIANSDYKITYNSAQTHIQITELTKSTSCSQRHCDARLCRASYSNKLWYKMFY